MFKVKIIVNKKNFWIIKRSDFLLNCIILVKIVRLPGLIDTHVHLREPGAVHKVVANFTTSLFFVFDDTSFLLVRSQWDQGPKPSLLYVFYRVVT